MSQHSPYKGIDGYNCAGIEKDVHHVSRKKIVQDPYNLPKKNVSPGSVERFENPSASVII